MEPMKVHNYILRRRKKRKSYRNFKRVGLDDTILIDIHMSFLEDNDNVLVLLELLLYNLNLLFVMNLFLH